MKLTNYARQSQTKKPEGSLGLDIVVPFTTPPLTRVALTAAGRLSAELHPVIRMVRTQTVPFPLQLEAAPVSLDLLRRQLSPLAAEFGAQLQLCLTREPWEGLLHVLSPNSVVLLAARKRWWKTREERLATFLESRGHTVLLEFVH